MKVLQNFQHQVTETKDGPVDLTNIDVVWIMANINWYPKICQQIALVPKEKRPIIIVWHREPLPPSKASGIPKPWLNWRELARIARRDTGATDIYTNLRGLVKWSKYHIPDILVASSVGRCEVLAENNLNALFVPAGFDPAYDCADLKLERDIEVLFLGALDIPRRKKKIRQLQQRGINVLAAGDRNNPQFWGANRVRLLNRTQILLNIQRYPGEQPGRRFTFGMSNKALVISEPVYKPAPYIPGKHYVSATIEEMPHLIQHYLKNDAERKELVEAGYQLVSKELTVSKSVEKILTLIYSYQK